VQGKTNARVPGDFDNFGHCRRRDLHSANNGVPKKNSTEIDPRQEAAFRAMAPGHSHVDCLSVGRRCCVAALAQKSHRFWAYRARARLFGLVVVLGAARIQTKVTRHRLDASRPDRRHRAHRPYQTASARQSWTGCTDPRVCCASACRNIPVSSRQPGP
jgi:hypothetical protein